MGFGLLLIGYFVTFIMSLTLYGWAFRFVGYTVIAYSCVKLREYFPKFTYVFYSAAALWITGGVETVCGALQLFGSEAAWISDVTVWVNYAITVLVFAFHMLMLWAIRGAAGEVGLEDKKISALTDMILVCVGFAARAMALAGLIPMGLSLLIQLVWTVMVLVLLFGCYMRICPAGDEEMPRKESRIGLVNKFNESLEKREQEAVARTQREIEERKAARDAKYAKNKHTTRKK